MNERLLQELRQPDCYPHHPAAVELVQTHLSVVCLAGEVVYKLKKSVTLPFVDFGLLAARRAACREEVRLNRRLCPDTYLGTAALRRREGLLQFAQVGDDEADDDVEVAVVMRRLPAERMLDVLVHDGTASEQEIAALAEHVARFHAAADRSPAVSALGAPRRLHGFALANFDELLAMRTHGLSETLLQCLRSATDRAFTRQMPRFERRVDAGRVVDGHGDLHARNVCMTSPPTVYDCIEFEPAFRCGDVATEIAFLAMDLRYRAAGRLAEVFVQRYVTASGDTELPELLPLTSSYRAMVRAKVAAVAAGETELSEADRTAAATSAQRHLLLAAACAVEAAPRPWWIVVCGPPASGKSSLCAALAAATSWPHFATDAVRKKLLAVPAGTTLPPDAYTAEMAERTYVELLRLAANAADRAVLLDGNFATPELRDRAATEAARAGRRVAFVLLDVDVDTARARAAARVSSPRANDASDAGPEIAAALHRRFEPPPAGTADAARTLALSGRLHPDELVRRVFEHLLSVA